MKTGADNQKKQCISPFLKQCFVTAGVSLNMMNLGATLGFPALLLPELRKADSEIPIDDSSGSWIASLPAITTLIGVFIGPVIMGRLGRKIVNLTGIITSIVGWLLVVFSNSIDILYAARSMCGIGSGIILSAAAVMIGEYTSPKDRGVFLATISIFMGLGVLFIQSVGSFVTWKISSMACIGVNIIIFIIVIFSPESPTFLAVKGKYDECRKIFRWLRGDSEDEELEKMIKTIQIARNDNEKPKEDKTLSEKIKIKIDYIRTAFTKKEFYKPIIICIHVNILAQWSGSNTLNAYTIDYIEQASGYLNPELLVISLQINRVVTSLFGLIIVKRLKRRTILFTLIPLNIAAHLSVALCSYAHEHWHFNYPWVCIIIMHVQMFAISTGTVPLANILTGEIFPVEYKSLCGGIGTVFLALALFANLKTIPMFFNLIGVHGSLFVHSGIDVYCMLVVGLLLPETKDRTLQDIEEEFSGKKFEEK